MMSRINRIVLLIYLTVFLISASRTVQGQLPWFDPLGSDSWNESNSIEYDVLNICEAEFDAVAFTRDDQLIFVGKYVYSRNWNQFTRIHKAFQLPENLTKIDAFFMDAKNNAHIFIGQDVHVSPAGPINGYPRTERIYRPTNAPTFEHVDAVFEYDGTYYVASSDQYWKLSNRYDPYPNQKPVTTQRRNKTQSLGDFVGARLPLTTAFTDRKGKTYFVTGNRYYPIDVNKKEVLTSLEKSTRDFVCSPADYKITGMPSCCLDQPRRMVKAVGPRALFLRYGMRQSEVFDICKEKFDTIALARNSLFMFIGKYMYSSAQGEFMLIRDAYPALPENLTKIDAYLFLPNGKEYFYIGRKLYIISNDYLEIAVNTVDLSDLLFNSEIDHVDAVFHYNKGLITIAGDQYWACDDMGKINAGPFKMSNFNGPLLKVANELEGISYIVHDGQYLMMGVGGGNHTQHAVIKQKDLVCHPRVLENLLPATQFENLLPPRCCNH